MGLDAKMFVVPRHPMTPDDFEKLEADTDNAFGRYLLGGRESGLGYSCLDPDVTTNGQVDSFSVRLTGRYYSPGYERGDLPVYLALRRWFRSRLPGCEVWYGTEEAVELLDDEAEQKLWDHFVRFQHRPYQDAFK